MNPDIVGNRTILDETSNEVEVGVTSSWVGDLNLLEATFDEKVKEGRLLLDGHRIGEGLISIAEVSGEPHGWLGESFGRPLTIVKF